MRALGLDVGTKTIGVALSDELGAIAQPLLTVRRTNLREDLASLVRLVAEHSVGRLVVGLPMNMDGTEGASAVQARKLGEAVSQQTGLPVVYWDERLSTVAAQRALLEADVSRADRRKLIDKVAAALILQGWLDSQATSRGYEE